WSLGGCFAFSLPHRSIQPKLGPRPCRAVRSRCRRGHGGRLNCRRCRNRSRYDNVKQAGSMHRRRVIAMPKFSSSHLKILVTAVISGLALAGCSNTDSAGSEPAGEPQAGGTLTYASGDAEPDCLDPHYGGNYPQGLIATQYLETLFTKDDDGQTIPWLAETSEISDDGLTHTISVTDGITFHDGTPL